MTPDAVFEAHRPRLFSLAYRMTGRATEAEDLVQDAYLRWREADQNAIRSPQAFLTTVLNRLCLDHLRSAARRREEYIGPWLPEPIDVIPRDEPVQWAERRETLSLAFLALLERLNPVERAVFLLHDIFEHDFAEIGRMLGKREDNCRQIARRARQRLSEGKARYAARPEEQDRLAERFLAAIAQGNLASLAGMLTEGAILWSDGGGRVPAALNPIRGADAISRFLVGIRRKASSGQVTQPLWIHGQAGYAAVVGDRLYHVVVLEIEAGRVTGLQLISNPEKLEHAAARLGLKPREPGFPHRSLPRPSSGRATAPPGPPSGP